jgi:hypothetical protein
VIRVSLTTRVAERRTEASGAARDRTVEKLRRKQMALKEQAAPFRTTVRDFDRVWCDHCPDEAPKPVASALMRTGASQAP